MLHGAAKTQTIAVPYRSAIYRPIQHGNDNLGTSASHGPQPLEAWEAGYQFARNIKVGHGGAPVV
jgi:hypothetical protein